MIKKVLWLLVVVGAIGLLSLSSVAAQEAGVSRSLPAGPVAPGDELEVTISNVGLADGVGVAVETLPAGFSYVDDSAVVTNGGSRAGIGTVVSGQTVSFRLVSVDSFTYKVAVGSEVEEGQHTFSGVLQKLSGDEPIGGDDSLTVEAGATTPEPETPTAPPDTTPGGVSRSLPAGPPVAAPGDELEVTISNVGLADGAGVAVETLPAGFSYVDDSAVVTNGGSQAGIGAVVSGQTVSFRLVSVDSFTYKVAVGSEVGEGQHTFSGVLQKLSGNEPIGGDDSVMVATAPPDTGAPGPRGPAGPKGNAGSAGPKGDAGSAGPKGDAGSAGPKGDAGSAGPKGDAGSAGPKGETGDAGPAGPKGETGDAGPASPKGETGDAGPAGPKGETGDAGPAGPKGETGDAGPAGPKGETGDAGSAGPKGETGDAGSAGPKGETGDAGPKGETGDAGSAGPKGDSGDAGPKGDAGSRVLGIVSLILSFVAVLVAGGVLLMRRRD